MEFLVGTFNTPSIYTLSFTPPSKNTPQASLHVVHRSPGIGHHSWISLSSDKTRLYATVWKTPSAVAAYSIERKNSSSQLTLLNSSPVAAQNGYVCVSRTHLFSVSGPSGEVFELDSKTGAIGDLVQTLSFVDNHLSDVKSASKSSGDIHGDFGGIRHGAHSVDLSPDGKSLYVADIGRNCVWCYAVKSEDRVPSIDKLKNFVGTGDYTANTNKEANQGPLSLEAKHVAPRTNDGPRHTTPHPNGLVLYSLQEHSGMVDIFNIVGASGIDLEHVQGVSIMPAGKDAKDFWADEVRVSAGTQHPKYLYASTRGLDDNTKGYVAVYALTGTGLVDDDKAIDIFETATSGGIANAVEPCPSRSTDGTEYMALTDSLEGWVFILSFDGKTVREIARVKLEEQGYEVVKAATAVWL